jgi:hypothetical protein
MHAVGPPWSVTRIHSNMKLVRSTLSFYSWQLHLLFHPHLSRRSNTINLGDVAFILHENWMVITLAEIDPTGGPIFNRSVLHT